MQNSDNPEVTSPSLCPKPNEWWWVKNRNGEEGIALYYFYGWLVCGNNGLVPHDQMTPICRAIKERNA